MTLKKTTLLASMALALVAFIAPAAAQAEGPTIEGTGRYEGTFSFKVLLGPAAGSEFECHQVTVELVGNVPPDTTATVTKFNPTTSTCTGTGIFTNCTLAGDHNNLPWIAHSDTDHTLTVTKPEGDITIKNTYDGAGCTQTESHVEFGSWKVTPAETEGEITSLSVHGVTTNTAVTTAGTLHKEPNEPAITLTTD
jgi:hypothetical protein